MECLLSCGHPKSKALNYTRPGQSVITSGVKHQSARAMNTLQEHWISNSHYILASSAAAGNRGVQGLSGLAASQSRFEECPVILLLLHHVTSCTGCIQCAQHPASCPFITVITPTHDLYTHTSPPALLDHAFSLFATWVPGTAEQPVP